MRRYTSVHVGVKQFIKGCGFWFLVFGLVVAGAVAGAVADAVAGSVAGAVTGAVAVKEVKLCTGGWLCGAGGEGGWGVGGSCERGGREALS